IDVHHDGSAWFQLTVPQDARFNDVLLTTAGAAEEGAVAFYTVDGEGELEQVACERFDENWPLRDRIDAPGEPGEYMMQVLVTTTTPLLDVALGGEGTEEPFFISARYQGMGS
ncbi:MAG: hypothetical protein R3185_05675, partial [Candidatus Thermoplasmatota archaeon]|nr:hypothetical protein [Candidatus Thermoplasmatota archaeon]